MRIVSINPAFSEVSFQPQEQDAVVHLLLGLSGKQTANALSQRDGVNLTSDAIKSSLKRARQKIPKGTRKSFVLDFLKHGIIAEVNNSE